MSTERAVVRDAETFFLVEGNTYVLATVSGRRVPRCLRTQGRTYALRRDLGGHHVALMLYQSREGKRGTS